MYSVIETESFAEWVDNIRDMPTRIRLRRRVNKAKLGNLGKSCKTLRNVWYMSACNGILTGHEAKQP